jgi:hypothetical protein
MLETGCHKKTSNRSPQQEVTETNILLVDPLPTTTGSYNCYNDEAGIDCIIGVIV